MAETKLTIQAGGDRLTLHTPAPRGELAAARVLVEGAQTLLQDALNSLPAGRRDDVRDGLTAASDQVAALIDNLKNGRAGR